VRNQLTKALRDQQLGLPVAAERQTTSAFLQKWLEGTAKPRLRARTDADYTVVVTKHLIPVIGNILLQKLGPEHVRDLLQQKGEAGLAPRRVRIIRAVLHTALAQAAAWGLTGRNVADLVKAPRAVRFLPTVLDQEQAKRLLKVAKANRIGALFSVALAVGLRLGEAFALAWSDVDSRRERSPFDGRFSDSTVSSVR
jgi:integrase